MDLISIVVAVYNAENTIKKCVDSLLNQSYTNIEIILVNDCSKDDSQAICNEYSAHFSNIVVVNNAVNSGVSFTRNAGIEKACGKYICFVDSDDYVENDYVNTLFINRKNYNTMPICGFTYHDEVAKSKPVNYGWSGKEEIVSLGKAFQLYDELYLTALWNKLFDKQYIDEYNIRFDKNLSMGEDLRFSVDYFQKANIKEIYAFSEHLYHYTKLNSNTLMSEYARHGIDDGLKSLEIIKNLAIKFNAGANEEFSLRVESLKKNLIYFIIRDNKYSKKEKIQEIKKFAPVFSNSDYRKSRIGYYKEKIATLLNSCD